MKVKISYGLTINKGNYESERIDASIEVEAKAKEGVSPKEELDTLFDIIKEWVWKKAGKL